MLANTGNAQVNYQGRLTDDTGAPIGDATAIITFSLWDASTNGNKIWGDQEITADLIDGRFNVILGPGDDDPSPRSLDQVYSQIQGSKFLQLQVNTDPPLPRQELLQSLSALHATSADGLGYTVELNQNVTPPEVTIGASEDGANLFVDGQVTVGTDADNADLEVHGDIKLGPTASLAAVAANSDLRIVWGGVNGNGTIAYGDGFSVTLGGNAGRFDINFSPAFDSAPAVVVQTWHTNDRPHRISKSPSSSGTERGFVIYVWESDNKDTWTRNRRGGFDFIAIGPR